jgi:hypothetical protein
MICFSVRTWPSVEDGHRGEHDEPDDLVPEQYVNDDGDHGAVFIPDPRKKRKVGPGTGGGCGSAVVRELYWYCASPLRPRRSQEEEMRGLPFVVGCPSKLSSLPAASVYFVDRPPEMG